MDQHGRTAVLQCLRSSGILQSLAIDAVLEALDKYTSLILASNSSACSLIGKTTVPVIWSRHILDCLQVALKIFAAPRKVAIDLGSGAGLPGIVIAIINPDCNVLLLEKSLRKSLFLRNTISELCLPNIEVHNKDIKDFDNSYKQIASQYVVARAFKPLKDILDMTRDFTPNAVYYLQKGLNYRKELELAKKYHRFRYAVEDDITGRGGVLITLRRY